MHPVANATVSGSLAAAIIGLTVAVLGHFNVQVSPDVAGYGFTILTAISSYALHRSTTPSPEPAKASA